MKVKRIVEKIVKYRLYILLAFVVIPGVVFLINFSTRASRTGEDAKSENTTDAELVNRTEADTEWVETATEK